MRYRRFFHITTKEKAKNILREGFKPARVFLTKEEHLFKWIRILSRELSQDVVILFIGIPWNYKRKEYLWDWGDQWVFDPYIVNGKYKESKDKKTIFLKDGQERVIIKLVGIMDSFPR